MPCTHSLLPGLSVVLSCADDEQRVVGAIRAAGRAAARCAARHEVVVVDGGSRDATLALASAEAAADPRVRVLGAASLRTAVAAARLDWVLLTDTAGDLEQLDAFAALAARYELVVGVRARRRLGRLRRADDGGAFALVDGLALRDLALPADATQLAERGREAGWRVCERPARATPPPRDTPAGRAPGRLRALAEL